MRHSRVPGPARAIAGRTNLQVLVAVALLVLVQSCYAGLPLKHVVQRDLRSTDDLSCHAYLGWNSAEVQHVFLWMSGTGIYSSAFVHPSVVDALKVNPAAYLTFDKPGIRAPFQDPARLSVNDDELKRYTQGDMLACAKDAMRWSEETFGHTVHFHLRGHSEGALIALFLYENLLSQDPDVAARVSSLVLSGIALEPFKALVERQLSDMPNEQGTAMRDAIKSCDWSSLKTHLAVSCKYLEDAYSRSSGRSVFESIALQAATAPFFVFQGNNDSQTPVQYVRELETWNAQRGHLSMSFRYYEGGHVGAPAGTKDELSALLVKLTGRVPSVHRADPATE
jgi:hypothetical protein